MTNEQVVKVEHKFTLRPKFAALILSHGRPEKVYTIHSLRKHGYTGRIVIVVDDEDKTASMYKDLYGEEVVTFCKAEVAKEFDIGDNFEGRHGVVYARNASHRIARDLGLDYFIMLDDDYIDWRYKCDDNLQYIPRADIVDLDSIFEILLRYLDRTSASAVAIAQGGDFIGGENGGYAQNIRPRRKCMNSFVCDARRPFQFVGRINEDATTAAYAATTGTLFLTIPILALQQLQTQANSGGLTEQYLNDGTYVKSFYSVMYCPSAVKVTMMGTKFRRLHHMTRWGHVCPKIIAETHRK